MVQTDELGFYQLLKNILTASMVIQGRFFVIADKAEINSNNFAQIEQDFMTGLVTGKKYPCALMTAPTHTQTIDDRGWIKMRTSTYFLTTYQRTGDGFVKQPDLQTNLSMQTFAQDWKDMAQCAEEFVRVFRQLTRTPDQGIPITEAKAPDMYSRVSYKGSDVVNGICLHKEYRLYTGWCEALQDYSDIGAINTDINWTPHPLAQQ